MTPSVCGYWLSPVRLSPLVGTPLHTRKSEAKAAGQRRVLVSVLFVVVWGNMTQARRGRRGTDRHAGEEGAQTDRDTRAEVVRGQTGGAGEKQTAAV